MAVNSGAALSKILMGAISFLVAVIGYFLVGRNEEVSNNITKLWEQNSATKTSLGVLSLEEQKLEGDIRWILQENQDQENRLRALEQRPRHP